jgi:hypothetical protein
MSQHDFQFFANLMIFFSQQKKIKYSLFIFLFHICARFQTKKKLVMRCVFQCFQSHCHISKELHEILRMIGAITIFGKNSFIFNFVSLVQGGWVHI